MLNDPKLTDFSAFNALISLYLKLARNKLILFKKKKMIHIYTTRDITVIWRASEQTTTCYKSNSKAEKTEHAVGKCAS